MDLDAAMRRQGVAIGNGTWQALKMMAKQKPARAMLGGSGLCAARPAGQITGLPSTRLRFLVDESGNRLQQRIFLVGFAKILVDAQFHRVIAVFGRSP